MKINLHYRLTDAALAHYYAERGEVLDASQVITLVSDTLPDSQRRDLAQLCTDMGLPIGALGGLHIGTPVLVPGDIKAGTVPRIEWEAMESNWILAPRADGSLSDLYYALANIHRAYTSLLPLLKTAQRRYEAQRSIRILNESSEVLRELLADGTPSLSKKERQTLSELMEWMRIHSDALFAALFQEK